MIVLESLKIDTFSLILILLLSFNFSESRGQINNLVENQLDSAVLQYEYFMKNIPEDKIPKTLGSDKNSLRFCSLHDWTIGFYPGTLWYLYEFSKDKKFEKAAEKKMNLFEIDKKYEGTHDLGFMMFTSFGNGYRITGNKDFKDVLLTSAASLSTRFNDSVGAIKSWNWKGKYPVIIDNMMNLELLTWAVKNGGNHKYLNEAISHANKTKKNHFRSNFSSWHVVLYDSSSGKVVKKQTAQGFSDSSSWARGQSWGLYGYTMMFRETGDSNYLYQAKNIANFILTNPHLPKDMIPYWDYDSPDIPNTYRDVSAASIMASALIELSEYVEEKKERGLFKNAAEKILISLSSSEYRYRVGEGMGFLLRHSVGNLPGNVEIDVPLSYADYYYIEALMRYKNWEMD